MKDWFLGRWNNLRQAQTNPTRWAHACVSVTEEDEWLHIKQWYDYQGEASPYRERYHLLEYISVTEVIVLNFSQDKKRNECCDMLVRFDGVAWNGSGGLNCRIRNANVESFFRLTENHIEAYDIGQSDTGELVFGGRDPYLFDRA